MRFLLVLALGVAVSDFAQSQTNSFWQILAEVGFEKQRDSKGVITEVPRFSRTLRQWEGKKISLKGYVIPVSEVGDARRFMLSSLPFNVCYFCGAAGPETVVQVESNDAVSFSTRPILMEGILHLNDKDPDQHIYILKSAKIIP